MRILVTGKNGQVAQALAHSGGSQRHELVFLGRPEIDLAHPATLWNPVLQARPDIIFSVAAHTQVDRCEREKSETFAINAEAPGVLAKAAAHLDIPIVHLSTDYVFDGKKRTPYVESDAAAPVNVYGLSKLAGEHAIAAATPRHAIVRVTWVYSVFGANFVKTMLDLARTRTEIRVVDDQIACPTSAVELANNLFSMAERLVADPDPTLYGVFHGAGASCVDRHSFADAIFEAAATRGYPTPVVRRVKSADFPAAAPRPVYSALNNQKLSDIYKVSIPGWRDRLHDVVNAILKAQGQQVDM